MNKKGFSLVELMIAIVIVGILAAYVGPSYQEGVRKAKLMEFSSMLSRIRVKQEQYYGESRKYLPISKATWKEELRNNFRMNVEAQYFDYEVTVGADGKSYEIIATLKEDLGRAKVGAQAKIDQNGNKSFSNDADGGLESYTGDWKELVEN